VLQIFTVQDPTFSLGGGSDNQGIVPGKVMTAKQAERVGIRAGAR
jgi:hypothetical protein